MELTTISLTVLHHDSHEMNRMVACVALILSGIHNRDAEQSAAREQTKAKVVPAPEPAASMVLWRRTLVARHFNMSLSEVEAYASTLNQTRAGVRETDEMPARRTAGDPIFTVIAKRLKTRVLRRRSGKLAPGTSLQMHP